MSGPYRVHSEVLRVVEWDQENLLHRCVDSDGYVRRVDLHVDGAGIPTGEVLVGQSVHIEGSQAYIEIAHKVTLVEPDELDSVPDREHAASETPNRDEVSRPGTQEG